MRTLVHKILNGDNYRFRETFVNICGDTSRRGFRNAVDRFSGSKDGQILNNLSERYASPELLHSSFKRFLLEDGGCSKSSPGGLRHSTLGAKKEVPTERIGSGGLIINTSEGQVVVGVHPSKLRTFPEAKMVIPLMSEGTAENYSSPVPMILADKVFIGGKALPFNTVISAGPVTIESFDHSLRVYVGGEYQGEVELLKALANPHMHRLAWSFQMERMLDAVASFLPVLENILELGLSMTNKHPFILKLENLYAAIPDIDAFIPSNSEQRNTSAFVVAFAKALKEALLSLEPIRNSISASSGTRTLPLVIKEDLEMAWMKLKSLLEPLSHLQAVYARSNLKDRLDLRLPSNLPNIRALDMVALNMFLDEIVYQAWKAANPRAREKAELTIRYFAPVISVPAMIVFEETGSGRHHLLDAFREPFEATGKDALFLLADEINAGLRTGGKLEQRGDIRIEYDYSDHKRLGFPGVHVTRIVLNINDPSHIFSSTLDGPSHTPRGTIGRPAVLALSSAEEVPFDADIEQPADLIDPTLPQGAMAPAITKMAVN